MKRLICFFMLVLIPGLVIYSQAPQAFKYQAIARDDAGNILSNWDIGIQINILKGGQDGSISYTEIHRVKSSQYGMITLSIGEGTEKNGDFEAIDWGSDRFYIKMEMDIENGNNFKEMGTTQLSAVPYALYAEEAGKLRGQSDRSRVSGTSTGNTGTTTGSYSEGGNRTGTPNAKLSSGGDSHLAVNTGKVGVGTISPAEKLHVVGNILATGNITASNNMVFYDEDGNPRKAILKSDGTLSFEFLCEGEINDPRDGQYYDIIQIGNQCWMAENMNVGTEVNTATGQTNNSLTEKYCYDNLTVNCDEQGGLYKWWEMLNWGSEGTRGICLKGWHVPDDNEVKVLEGTVDSNFGIGDTEWNVNNWRGFDAGLNLKTTTGWFDNGNGTDAYGFSAKASGYWVSSGSFLNIIKSWAMWTTAEVGVNAFFRSLNFDENKVNAGLLNKDYALSLRCIKDFECGDTLIDYRDFKNYGTIQIGDQCWMSQNLNVGIMTDISNLQQNTGTIEKYCYDNNEDNCDTLGGLYQWDEAMQYETTTGIQGVCPEGWHIPAEPEFQHLGNYLGGLSVAGGKLKATGTIETGTGQWHSPNSEATNETGFSALPGGYAHAEDTFYDRGYNGFFLSSTSLGPDIFYGAMYYDLPDFFTAPDVGIHGRSIRCLKNE